MGERGNRPSRGDGGGGKWEATSDRDGVRLTTLSRFSYVLRYFIIILLTEFDIFLIIHFLSAGKVFYSLLTSVTKH